MEVDGKRRLILRVSGLADLFSPSHVASAEVFSISLSYMTPRIKPLIDFPLSLTPPLSPTFQQSPRFLLSKVRVIKSGKGFFFFKNVMNF